MKAFKEEIFIRKEDFKALCERRNLPLPSFWFANEAESDVAQNADDRQKKQPKGAGQPPHLELQEAHPLAQIRQLPNLTADEVSLTLLADNMIIVEARDKIARIHYAALELINRHTGRVNIPGLILEGLIESKRVPTNKENVKRISELRKRLIKHLGLRSNPFNLRRGVGWEPLFRISDNRNAQDERAKHAAKHVEFNEDLKEHTSKIAVITPKTIMGI
jgi:hypothetical protein